MIYFEEPGVSHNPWTLSGIQEKNCFFIPKEISKYLRRHHVQAVDFLYQNYIKQFKGAILNEENGFNMQLQVSAFLNSISNNYKGKFLALVICPDSLIVNWHYHLTCHGKLKVEIVKPTTCSADFDEETAAALLLSFSAIRLAEPLANYSFFSVIVDHLDLVASKRSMNKLRGDFNIGLTERNFYVNPDQRLQWLMLNWCNPGCVGKLADYYRIDNDNFANYRDNYRRWWFRLTWAFCDAFTESSDEEQLEYDRLLSEWSCRHNITSPVIKEENKRKKCASKTDTNLRHNYKKKRKGSRSDEDFDKRICTAHNNNEIDTIDPILIEAKNVPLNSESKHENDNRFTKNEDSTYSLNNDQILKEESVLIDIINNEIPGVLPTLDQEARILCKKEKLLSQVYQDNENVEDDFPKSLNNLADCDEDKDFFRAFI